MAPVFLTPLFVVAMFAPFFFILNEQFYDDINSYLDKIWKYPISWRPLSWRPFYFEWLKYSIDGPPMWSSTPSVQDFSVKVYERSRLQHNKERRAGKKKPMEVQFNMWIPHKCAIIGFQTGRSHHEGSWWIFMFSTRDLLNNRAPPRGLTEIHWWKLVFHMMCRNSQTMQYYYQKF